MTTEHEPLPDNWEELDYVGSYYEGMREIGRRVKAGEMELPDMFRPRDRESVRCPK